MSPTGTLAESALVAVELKVRLLMELAVVWDLDR
jgi:hypothetical protein